MPSPPSCQSHVPLLPRSCKSQLRNWLGSEGSHGPRAQRPFFPPRQVDDSKQSKVGSVLRDEESNTWLTPPWAIHIRDLLVTLNQGPTPSWPLSQKLIGHVSVFQGHILWSPLAFQSLCSWLYKCSEHYHILQESFGGVNAVNGCITFREVRHEVKGQLTSLLFSLCFMF